MGSTGYTRTCANTTNLWLRFDITVICGGGQGSTLHLYKFACHHHKTNGDSSLLALPVFANNYSIFINRNKSSFLLRVQYVLYIMYSTYVVYVVHYVQSVAQPRGRQAGICPPPSGLRQALSRECTHQADQGENGNLKL